MGLGVVDCLLFGIVFLPPSWRGRHLPQNHEGFQPPASPHTTTSGTNKMLFTFYTIDCQAFSGWTKAAIVSNQSFSNHCCGDYGSMTSPNHA